MPSPVCTSAMRGIKLHGPMERLTQQLMPTESLSPEQNCYYILFQGCRFEGIGIWSADCPECPATDFFSAKTRGVLMFSEKTSFVCIHEWSCTFIYQALYLECLSVYLSDPCIRLKAPWPGAITQKLHSCWVFHLKNFLENCEEIFYQLSYQVVRIRPEICL